MRISFPRGALRELICGIRQGWKSVKELFYRRRDREQAMGSLGRRTTRISGRVIALIACSRHGLVVNGVGTADRDARKVGLGVRE